MGGVAKPPHSKRRHKVAAGLSLTKFAKAKASGYDKRHALERERALRAKKINKFRKLKDRLSKEGKLKPAVDLEQLERELHGDEQDQAASKSHFRGRKKKGDGVDLPLSGTGAEPVGLHSRGRAIDAWEEVEEASSDDSDGEGGDLDMRRILARAGPPPSDEDDDDDSGGADDRADDNDDDDDDELGDGGLGAATDTGHGGMEDVERGQRYGHKPKWSSAASGHPSTAKPVAQHGNGGEAQREGFDPTPSSSRRGSGFDSAPSSSRGGASHGNDRRSDGVNPMSAKRGATGLDDAGELRPDSSIGGSSLRPDIHAGKRTNGKGERRKKPLSRLERLAAKVQADKEAKTKAREEARRAAEEHQARVAQVEAARKVKSALLRKKTRTGQPVMKYRIEGILEKLAPGSDLFSH